MRDAARNGKLYSSYIEPRGCDNDVLRNKRNSSRYVSTSTIRVRCILKIKKRKGFLEQMRVVQVESDRPACNFSAGKGSVLSALSHINIHFSILSRAI